MPWPGDTTSAVPTLVAGVDEMDDPGKTGTTVVNTIKAELEATFLRMGVNPQGSDADLLARLTRIDPDVAWTAWTPAITGSTTNPTLGTNGVAGCVIHGRRLKLGRLVVATFNLRWRTTSVPGDEGSGTYQVSTPVQMKTAGFAAGMSSDLIGFGKLYRGYSAGDLLVGAHLDCSLHISDGATGNKVLMVFHPGAQAVSIERTSKVTNQTGIGTGATDITGLSVAFTPLRAGTRVRVVADLHVWKEAGSDPNMVAQITTSAGTVLRRAACHSTVYGSAFGTGLCQLRVEYIDENPTVGTSKTYKVQCFGYDSTMAQFGSAEVPATITVEELAASSTSGLAEGSDYVASVQPWNWSDGDGGPEIWGLLVGESAA